MKTKIIPFDLETAKKIQAGEIEGKIKTTRSNQTVRIICWDRMSTETPIVLLVQYDNWEGLYECNSIGEYTEGWGDDARLSSLVIEIPDDTPYEFKPFDRVLVRYIDGAKWRPKLFEQYGSQGTFITQDGVIWNQCIPYEGNEHLVGTTDKPKELC